MGPEIVLGLGNDQSQILLLKRKGKLEDSETLWSASGEAYFLHTIMVPPRIVHPHLVLCWGLAEQKAGACMFFFT